jgi:hypothetical protein
MGAAVGKTDWLTVAAIGLLAMCLVTFDHEALGHGGACLALHGHITALSSSVFRCDRQSGLVDAAGPIANVLGGLIALAARLLVPWPFVKLRLLLILVTALSFFWEGGYLIHAMHRQDGDLYSVAQWWLGSISVWQRWIGAALGLALYLFAAGVTAWALLRLWPEAKTARFVARTVWASAATGAALAALFYTGGISRDLRDAVLEIGAAAFPLLLIPFRTRPVFESHPAVAIDRDYRMILLAGAVYAAFTMSLGRGIP